MTIFSRLIFIVIGALSTQAFAENRFETIQTVKSPDDRSQAAMRAFDQAGSASICENGDYRVVETLLNDDIAAIKQRLGDSTKLDVSPTSIAVTYQDYYSPRVVGCVTVSRVK